MDANKLKELYQKATIAYKLALGYPVNRNHTFKINLRQLGLVKNSFATCFLNNIGSPYSQGKYISDNVKEIEVELINLLANHLNLPIDNSFGYVTNGGTEANFTSIWWHREFLYKEFNCMPIIITSSKSHYSVNKIANQLQLKLVQIPENFGALDLQELERVLTEISSPVIFWDNIGTTVEGTIDDIVAINNLLKKCKNGKYKVHGDGALYGLVIPYLAKFNAINCIFDYIDTFSMSGHKLLGSYFTSGVVLCKRSYIHKIIASNKRAIDYLQDIDDVTFSGSRSGFLAIELYLLLVEAFKQNINGKTNLEVMWNKCVMRANWFYTQIIKIIDEGNPNLVFHNYQLNIVLPAPKDDAVRDQLAEKYKLMAVGEKQFGICVLPRSTKPKLKLFLSDYVATMPTNSIKGTK